MILYFKKKWLHLSIENPLRTWWKARKYFIRPKISIHFFTNPIYNCPYASLNWISNLLDICSNDIGWKDKFDDPRFETAPYIWVCLFKRIGFSINFIVNKDGIKENLYWEYLLNYLYYSKSLKIWDKWTDKDEIIETPKFCLNKKGLKKVYG